MDIKTFRRTTPSSVGRSGIDRSTDLFLTYQLTMALYVETSWCPYQLFHRTFTIDLTASIVLCVVYTTFVGNSVSCRLPHLNLITKNLKFKGILPSYISFCVQWWKIQLIFWIISEWAYIVAYISTNSEFELTKAGFPRWQATFNFFHYLSMMRIKNLSTRIGAVCITSLYPQFNGSHFSQPPSSISTKWLHWVAKSCERWRMRTGLICGKQMREQQGCFNKKEKKMDLVSSLLYNCLFSYSSWGMTVGLTQEFWRKWLVWEKYHLRSWCKAAIKVASLHTFSVQTCSVYV